MVKQIIYFISLVAAFHLLSAGGCKKDDTVAPPLPETGKVTDIDGNVYKTIRIGTQVWMSENLRVTKYRDGSVIPYVYPQAEWKTLGTGARCPSTQGELNTAVYGYLYNWYAVNNSKNLAPTGWHIPSKAEWQVLIDFLGGNVAATDKMKDAGSTHWDINNTANNSSGFTALGAGIRFDNGNHSTISGGTPAHAIWWSSTTSGSTTNADMRDIHGNKPVVDGSHAYKYGLSVRCIKD